MSRRKTKEEFVAQARIVHGNTYDYSLVDYKDTNSKVTIICPIHGEFQQTPKKHLQGQKCPKCSGKLTIEERLEKAKEIHNGKYDYSKVQYVNAKTPVTIICPIHGEFQQNLDNHINGKCGCPKCANKNITTEEFIEKSRKIHGDKYDYSRVIYRNNRTPVEIICPEHGSFLQTPDSHLQGKGCIECGKKHMGSPYNTEIFIKKAKQIFPKYDYSKVKYINSITKVIVICPEHGEFEIQPSSLLQGHGCPKCSRKYNTAEDFIKRAKEIHGDKYNYSKLKWINSQTKVEIICPIHKQSFLQDPYKHLLGQGCPICAKQDRIQSTVSKGEDTIERWLIQNDIKFKHNEVCLKIEDLNIYPDFIINNTIIEYNGIQHYQYIPYFHKRGLIDFEHQQNRDQKLREYCKDNNINLIEIKYDQDIKEELEKIRPLIDRKI